MIWVYDCLSTKIVKKWIFFLLDKEKGGSLTVSDFEIAAKYGE